MWHGYLLLTMPNGILFPDADACRTGLFDPDDPDPRHQLQVRVNNAGNCALIEGVMGDTPTEEGIAQIIAAYTDNTYTEALEKITDVTLFEGDTWEEMRANAELYLKTNAAAWNPPEEE